ncbi:MAG TPA: IS630 family transposase, partial [Pirellulaceae bacterium]|nr:IS630 family transposase [Pirellulaceae bacterium]HJN11051.1 IS630 family transposase [Pirellulaceae bacterium]
AERRIAAWQADRNERQSGIDWQFSTDDARIKLKRLYPNIELR